MATLIYLLLIISIFSTFITIYRFTKFFASFSSLISTTSETCRDMPWKHVLTAGFLSLWRVLRHDGNAHAVRVLARNAALFFVSSVAMIIVYLLLDHLNAKYCVLPMTKVTSEGATSIVCDPPGNSSWMLFG